MSDDRKPKPDTEEQRKKDEAELEEGLEETFPASDPPSATREPTGEEE